MGKLVLIFCILCIYFFNACTSQKQSPIKPLAAVWHKEDLPDTCIESRSLPEIVEYREENHDESMLANIPLIKTLDPLLLPEENVEQRKINILLRQTFKQGINLKWTEDTVFFYSLEGDVAFKILNRTAPYDEKYRILVTQKGSKSKIIEVEQLGSFESVDRFIPFEDGKGFIQNILSDEFECNYKWQIWDEQEQSFTVLKSQSKHGRVLNTAKLSEDGQKVLLIFYEHDPIHKGKLIIEVYDRQANLLYDYIHENARVSGRTNFLDNGRYICYAYTNHQNWRQVKFRILDMSKIIIDEKVDSIGWYMASYNKINNREYIIFCGIQIYCYSISDKALYRPFGDMFPKESKGKYVIRNDTLFGLYSTFEYVPINDNIPHSGKKQKFHNFDLLLYNFDKSGVIGRYKLKTNEYWQISMEKDKIILVPNNLGDNNFDKVKLFDSIL